MIGERLLESRQRAGLTQTQLAVALGERYNGSMVSLVEHDHRKLRFDGAVNAARELSVSLDYLAGLTDDPTPVDDRVEELAAELRRTKEELERLRAQVAAEPQPLPYGPLEIVSGGLVEDEASAAGLRLVPDLDVEAAAGTEAYVEQELVVGHLAFREEWLTRTCVDPEQCRSIRVRGRSMEPTIQARARILVDTQRTRRLCDRIFVVSTPDGVLVKRLAREGDDWMMVSDNEDQEAYPPIPWPEGAVVRGQVMWTGKMLRGSR